MREDALSRRIRLLAASTTASCSDGVVACVAIKTEQEINGFGRRSIAETSTDDERLMRGGSWNRADRPVLSEGWMAGFIVVQSDVRTLWDTTDGS